MAVQANAQVTSVSSAVLQQNGNFSSSIQAMSTNNLLNPAISSGNVGTDTKPQLQQVRLVHAIPASSVGNIPMQQQIVRIIKQTPDGSQISNVINVRAPLSSPTKGATGAVINIPTGARVLTNQTKLKVGDTITIPKSSFAPEKVTTNLSSGQTAIITPSKIVSVSGSSTINPIFTSRPPSSTNPLPTPMTTVIHPNASFTHQVASPDRLATISPFWPQSPTRHKRERPPIFTDTTQGQESKRRRTPNSTEKGSKGLRHFAMLVCEKVKHKVTTTYNEVADELVAEYSDNQGHLSEQHYDQKNIRRRVYDALNVLMAMDIIYKDKKDIHWVGLPTNSAQEVITLQSEKKKREQRIEQKTLQLQELILQQIAFKNLVQRNKRLQETQGPPPENSSIQLPFIIVNTSKKTVIDCSISNDKYEYMFNFDNTFEIHDDIEVLKRMGMAYGLEAGRCSRENLKTAQTLVPPVLKPYLEQMAGYSSDLSNSGGSMKYTLQDAPRIVPNGSVSETSQNTSSNNNVSIKRESEEIKIGSAFTLGHVLDPEDQEVAMVTNGNSMSSSSSGMAMGLTPSRSSSSGLHSAVLSLTPMSSSTESESRGSTPLDSYET